MTRPILSLPGGPSTRGGKPTDGEKKRGLLFRSPPGWMVLPVLNSPSENVALGPDHVPGEMGTTIFPTRAEALKAAWAAYRMGVRKLIDPK